MSVKRGLAGGTRQTVEFLPWNSKHSKGPDGKLERRANRQDRHTKQARRKETGRILEITTGEDSKLDRKHSQVGRTGKLEKQR